jgi:OmpA-OmpF porin, OOP family
MTALRILCLVSASSALVLPLAAQSQALPSVEAPITLKNPYGTGRASLGINLSRSRPAYSCGATALFCDRQDRAESFYTAGFNLSLVGTTPPLWQALRLHGKLGTTYGRANTLLLGPNAPAAAEQGFGLSYGAGVSFAFTPRLSATLDWDSNDFRLPGAGRDPVRSTSLGLQYRY